MELFPPETLRSIKMKRRDFLGLLVSLGPLFVYNKPSFKEENAGLVLGKTILPRGIDSMLEGVDYHPAGTTKVVPIYPIAGTNRWSYSK